MLSVHSMFNRARLFLGVAIAGVWVPVAVSASDLQMSQGIHAHWSATGSWLGSPGVLSQAGAWAGELVAQRLFEPWPYRAVFAGPRFGILGGQRSWSTASPVGFLNATLGLEAQLWLVNVAGPGLAIDWVLPLNAEEARASDSLQRFRVESFMGVRVKRLGDWGALGLRAGMYYDRLWGLGLKAGLSLALGGVALP